LILVLDNRDSFTFNLVQAFQRLGREVDVLRADRTDVTALLRLTPTHVVIGPGPGRPEAARTSLEAIAALPPDLPVLGVCLGHQALGLAHGARVERARKLVHGRAVAIYHDGRGVFHGLPSPLWEARYNSLAVRAEPWPPELVVSARTLDGEVQGLRHRARPLEGIQFHPESVLSEHGLELLANFARL
jgi:anthranilate synthase/aminodeoxychorismate synthase-like glutamine amidotransferase